MSRNLLFTLALILTIVQTATAFETEKGRVSPFQIQAGPNQTAHLVKKGHYPVVAMPPKTTVEFDKRLSLAAFEISVSEGSPFSGWTLLRIEMAASRNIAGDVLFDETYHDIKLIDNTARKSRIKLDVMGEAILSSVPARYYMSVYPARLHSGALVIDYILRSPDRSKSVVLTHSIPITETVFTAGDVSVFLEKIDSAESGWSIREREDPTDSYKKIFMEMVKKCDIASCQVTFTSHIDSVGFVAFNQDFYESKPVRKKFLTRPIDMLSIYQACSISKVPCGYLYTKLANDGVVDLDTPLYKYYPKLLDRFRPEYRERVKLITGRMALTHTSGCGAGYRNTPLDYYPGFHYNYRNSNTVALQWTIEHLMGKPLDEVAEEYIYSKRNMPNSRYTWQPQYDSLAVYGWTGTTPMIRPEKWEHNDQGLADPDFWWEKEGFNNNCSFHFRTNSTEFNRFWSWYLIGADLTEDSFNRMIDDGAHIAKDITMEKGTVHHAQVVVVEENEELGTIIYHTGHNGDFRSIAMTFLDMNATMTLFVNCRHPYDNYNPAINVFLHNTEPVRALGWVAGMPVPGWKYVTDDDDRVAEDTERDLIIDSVRISPTQIVRPGAVCPPDPRLASAQVAISAESGSKYAKWELKRIVLSTSQPIVGTARYHRKRNDIMLVDDTAQGNAVTLEVAGAGPLGRKTFSFPMTVYPVMLKTGKIHLDYYLANGNQIEVLSHEVLVSGTLFEAGKCSSFDEVIPANPVAAGWTVRPFERDIDQIRNSLLSIMGKDRADLAALQVAYSDNLGEVNMTLSNDEWFRTNATRKAWIQPYGNECVFQACEAGALPFVYVVLKMVEDGKLDLDTPLCKYYPGLVNRFAESSRSKAKEVTVRQCLAHTSAISAGDDELKIRNIYIPGTIYAESRNNYKVLQWTVEYLTGKTAEELCRKAIFGPLGMKNTSYLWKKQFANTAVPAYTGNTKSSPRPAWSVKGELNTGLTLLTTASDFTKFLRWAAAGADLKPETLALAYGHNTHIPASEYRRERMSLWRGLGWIVEENTEFGTMLVHTGRNGAWRSTVVVLPESSKTFCLFTNTANRINYYDAILDLFFSPKEPLASFGCGYLYPLDNRK
ncbi:MAG: beta-lactamase family protein [Bacteroidales bacterium]|nr:beta-lactamase family protein [Bacteroidales bacterium]